MAVALWLLWKRRQRRPIGLPLALFAWLWFRRTRKPFQGSQAQLYGMFDADQVAASAEFGSFTQKYADTQNADIVVPKATRKVASVWTQGFTRLAPNSMIQLVRVTNISRRCSMFNGTPFSHQNLRVFRIARAILR